MKGFFSHLATALLGATIVAALTYLGTNTMDKKFAFQLTEPALIATQSGQQHYLLPSGTTVYHQASFAEGHSLYTIEVMFDGQLRLKALQPGDSAEPLWLYNLEATDVKKLLSEYPLNKADLSDILKARGVTRDELEQMVMDWVD
jgi:hypothetical protein